MGDDVHLAARVAGDEHAAEALDELRNHLFERFVLVGNSSRRGGGEVGFARLAENGSQRFEGIDAVERSQERKHDIAVVDGIGDRRRKGPPEGVQVLLIERHHDRSPLAGARRLCCRSYRPREPPRRPR